jgi:D-serine deaminase-like pyridoxal phosphate-dependent protein
MVGEPGVQGATVLGMQGMGVSTRSAAAVAVATTGLAGDMHMPKGLMLTMGWKSMTFAATCLPHWARLTGRTCSTEGAAPMVHINCAVMTVTCGIAGPARLLR